MALPGLSWGLAAQTPTSFLATVQMSAGHQGSPPWRWDFTLSFYRAFTETCGTGLGTGGALGSSQRAGQRP